MLFPDEAVRQRHRRLVVERQWDAERHQIMIFGSRRKRGEIRYGSTHGQSPAWSNLSSGAAPTLAPAQVLKS